MNLILFLRELLFRIRRKKNDNFLLLNTQQSCSEVKTEDGAIKQALQVESSAPRNYQLEASSDLIEREVIVHVYTFKLKNALIGLLIEHRIEEDS